MKDVPAKFLKHKSLENFHLHDTKCLSAKHSVSQLQLGGGGGGGGATGFQFK